MAARLPTLDKSESVLRTEAEHERALVAACSAAAMILEARGMKSAGQQEPLPVSTIELLKRLPRV
jgi:hypothetical protein